MAGLFDVMASGRDDIRRLDCQTDFRRTVQELDELRQSRFPDFGVFAASSEADRLVGGLLMVTDGVRSDGSGNTLLVGVNIFSGTQIARAAIRLRSNGNRDRVVGVVINALAREWRSEADGWVVPEVDELLFVDSLGRRQLTKCSVSSVGVAI